MRRPVARSPCSGRRDRFAAADRCMRAQMGSRAVWCQDGLVVSDGLRNRKDRLSPPLMFAFRSAHAARDANKKIDLRDEAGERVIAGRRSAGRAPITEFVLAHGGGARPRIADEHDGAGVERGSGRNSTMSANRS